MEDITIKEAKNQKDETIPMLRTYYITLARSNGDDWWSTGLHINKEDAIRDARMYANIENEVKIISIELPF